MVQANVTVTLCLPETIEQQFYKIINNVFSKFGKYRLKNDKDGIYYNIPHITLLSLGNCLNKQEEICKRIKPIIQDIKPINIRFEEQTCFIKEDSGHVVMRVKRTPELLLLLLHKKICNALSDLVELNSDFILDNFNPHITIISSVPKELAFQINNLLNISKFDFISDKVSVKTKVQRQHATQYKIFQLTG